MSSSSSFETSITDDVNLLRHLSSEDNRGRGVAPLRNTEEDEVEDREENKREEDDRLEDERLEKIQSPLNQRSEGRRTVAMLIDYGVVVIRDACKSW